MKRHNLYNVVILLCGLGFGLSCVEARAEKIPTLSQVSTKLPEAEQTVFRQKKMELEAVLKKFKAASDRFNGKPAKDQSDEEFAALTAERAQNVAAVKQFNLEMACSELKQQLARDQEAMRRQGKSIEQGQAELVDWTKKNEEAQKAALKRATNFLVDSLTAKLGEFTEGKLATLETNFEKRAPPGETWQRKIQKIQEFSAAEARLAAAVDGIKLAGFTGAAADGWREAKKWAAKNGKDAEALDAILAEWQRDPELKQIMQESGISTFSASLGFSKTLAPWAIALDFGQFLVGYGYDATNWALSKNRIEQQIANRDQDLKAVEALKKQIERTVAKLKACELDRDQSVNLAQ
jgi:hypothetical protein